MNRMNRNEEHNSNRQEPTLDPFARASGERLTGRKSEQTMVETDAATLPGQRSAASSTVMVAAACSRFVAVVHCDEREEEDGWNRESAR